MKNVTLEIKRLNQFNFILAERLDAPIEREIAGNKVIYNHKNLEKFYGTLKGAIQGYFRHLNINTPIIDKNLDLIKPNSKESLYLEYMEIDLTNKF
tara:strand:- start:853 stop:1140 length:288 start_codon:yes stop_codon:yes gene_type:complete